MIVYIGVVLLALLGVSPVIYLGIGLCGFLIWFFSPFANTLWVALKERYHDRT